MNSGLSRHVSLADTPTPPLKNPDRDNPDKGDDIPDTPPTEPQPAPIRDPRPPGTPRGPYIVR